MFYKITIKKFNKISEKKKKNSGSRAVFMHVNSGYNVVVQANTISF
jgi:hypothetical protein